MSKTLTHNGITIEIEPLNLPRRLSQIQKQTIRQVADDPQKWIDSYYEKFGNVTINPDDAKTLFPEYEADPLANVQGVHEASSIIAKLIFRLRLRELPEESLVMLTAGGAASGKTWATRDLKADLIYDSVMKSVDGNRELVDLIAATNHQGIIIYVLRDIKAAARSNVERSIDHKRVVPLEILAAGHYKSRKTFVEDTDDYASKKGFVVSYMQSIENAASREISFEDFAKIAHTDYSEVLQRARTASYEEIERNSSVYDGRIGDALEGRVIAPLDGSANSRIETSGKVEFEPDE